jgi:aerobic carbon-monoxide dehydrogenase medium subunit
MKARNFRYVRPASLQEAYRMLAEAGGEAVPIAGGQSLLAGLNMRLSSPKILVDIGNLAELTGQSYADGMVRLGALTRHRDLLSSAIVRAHLPLLAEAAPYIGHIAIRNRGTIGGSLAYADPAAELPACTVALGATLVLGSAKGERQVKAEDFFKGLFETDLQAGELIVEVKFPEVPTGTSTGFAELSRRHGDFALVGVAALAVLRAGEIESARIVYFGCIDRARVAASVSAALSGAAVPLEDALPYAAAIRNDVKPDDTPGLRADTKLHMATVLTRRALNSMVEQRTAWGMSS